MKIKEINDDYIIFEDDSRISFDHEQDCCEWNYADFRQLDDLARAHDFNMKELHFNAVEDSGFRFGDNRRMFFVPCYSVQNGYYSSDINIYYEFPVNGGIYTSLCVIRGLQCIENFDY